jgi:chemotaxis protein CheX
VNSPDELVEPFASSVILTLREMAGVEAAVREIKQSTGQDDFGDVSAVLRLIGANEGYLALSFPNATANALAARVLSDAANVNADMIHDCIGELVNVVAGQAKALLFGTPGHFTLSTPTVVLGVPELPAGTRWMAEFVSEVGEFRLHVRLPG